MFYAEEELALSVDRTSRGSDSEPVDELCIATIFLHSV